MSSTSLPGIAGWIVRIFVAACFVGGAVAAVSGRLVVAGVGFLVGHTLLAGAAVIQGQRRRGLGLSLSGVGWVALAVGLGASGAESGASLPTTPLIVGGFALVTAGTLLVVVAFGATASEPDAAPSSEE
ncbi:hypothetical protein [Halobellus rufus]|uniref:hypothetical protein n=1 Tax=Halobellus rufus TaxID=1448860 RepID=UPI0006791852|nr:hypothetical protein [Halobellus rufus]